MADRTRGVLVAAVLAAAPALVATPAATAVGSQERPGEWWWSAMGVDELHERGRGEGVTVAVVDGPIAPEVPELRGRIASTSTVCLDPAAPDRLRPSTGTGPQAQHATSMAALIAGSGRGTGPQGRGVRGIAPEATVRHYAVLYDAPAGDDKTCGVHLADGDDVGEAVARSVRQAVADGAEVVNLSIVSDYDADLDEALLAAYRAGAIVVAGTGNGADAVEYPGLGNGVVLVNPVDENALTTPFSVSGHPAIGLAAPGAEVMAGADDGSGWDSAVLGSGSSVATALVSGGIAAVWSAHPDATAGQVLQAVRRSVGLRADGDGYRAWFRRVGEDLPQVSEKNPAYGWGVFSPADAVRLDPTTLPKDNPFVRAEGTSGGPEPAQIAEAMGLAAASASPAAPTPQASLSAAAAPDEATADAGAPVAPVALVGGGVLALLVLGAGLLALRRRRADPATAPGADPAPLDDVRPSQGAPSAGGRTR